MSQLLPGENTNISPEKILSKTNQKIDLLALLEKLRKEDLEMSAKIKADIESSRGDVRDLVRSTLGILADQVLVQKIAVHLQKYPQVPRGGFESYVDYAEYMFGLNDILVHEKQMAFSSGEVLKMADPLKPGKYRDEIVVSCADGRSSYDVHVPAEKQVNRFEAAWLPVAGNVLFPKVKLENGLAETVSGLDEKNKAEVDERLTYLYGKKIDQALAEWQSGQGKVASLQIEFQSHVHADHQDKMGCGAHKCDLLGTQLETIKNAALTEAWLKAKYPEAFAAGFFKIIRTTFDMGGDKSIYSAAKVDQRIPAEKTQIYGKLFSEAAERFAPDQLTDKTAEVFRKFQGNPLKIDLEKHDEQIIRVSDNQFAVSAVGQSALKMSWMDKVDVMADQIRLLLTIVNHYFKGRNPHKPILMHLDIDSSRPDQKNKLSDLYKMLINDDKVGPLIVSGGIQCLITETNPETLESKVLEVL
ncbi:hypothetical protein IT411_04050 [Candidatus Peregrinibacteria bacterium]|nr:hypothetical protein [Candidatus Peregrinibacteria bacterium]